MALCRNVEYYYFLLEEKRNIRTTAVSYKRTVVYIASEAFSEKIDDKQVKFTATITA